MGNRRIILELDREPQDLQAVWRLDSIARLIQQALDTDDRTGLTDRRIAQLQQEFGANELVAAVVKPPKQN